jgi:NAD(P)-dependent dehydrogenase (short-subunit alcohol dehydrogenase family)
MRSPFDLTGKVALVTGASGGLGAHFAQLLAQNGAAIALWSRDQAKLSPVADALASQGAKVFAEARDVGTETDVVEGVARICDKLGVPDIVVNNAGISVVKPALEITRGDWESVLNTNLTGAWSVSVHAARSMRDAGKGGSIINISSIAGTKRVLRNVSPYVASKGGLTWLTRSMAIELAPLGIRVNAIAPGLFNTSIGGTSSEETAARRARMLANIPFGRIGEMQDLDGPFLLLASDASAYMTGSVLVVDGGYSESSL